MEGLKVQRRNPLIRLPKKWLDMVQPDKEPTVRLIKEVDGDRIIISADPRLRPAAKK